MMYLTDYLPLRTRGPLKKFFETARYIETCIGANPQWVERIYTPAGAMTSLGVQTAAHVYYNEEQRMCLSVSSHNDEVEIYFLVQSSITNKLRASGNGTFQIPARELSDEFWRVRSSLPQKLSVVEEIPKEHDKKFNSFYLLEQDSAFSLHWVDDELGVVREQAPTVLSSDAYQILLNDLKNSPDLLNSLLPKLKGFDENHGYKLNSEARDIRRDEDLGDVRCFMKNGATIRRFNLFKESLPKYSKHFPTIPDIVIEKISGCIDKYRDAYVNRCLRLANDLVVDKDATLRSLKTVFPAKFYEMRDTTFDVTSFYFFEMAQWMYAHGDLEPAKSLCELILEGISINTFLDRRAKEMIVDILMDERCLKQNKSANARLVCQYLLEISSSTGDRNDIMRTLKALGDYSGSPYPVVHRFEGNLYHFENEMILHQAEKLRELNERGKQKVSSAVQAACEMKDKSTEYEPQAVKSFLRFWPTPPPTPKAEDQPEPEPDRKTHFFNPR